MSLGIREIMIISTPEDTPDIKKLFGDGADFGLTLCYKVQDRPNGIAEAFILAEDFIGDDNVCLILGDNIFHPGIQINDLADSVGENDGAVICGYRVNNPRRYGVVKFDNNGKAISVEEKPENPQSDFAVVGLYFYTSDVVQKTKELRPSARGELEITDLNKKYLQENRMKVLRMSRGTAWLDAGTPDSLMDAAQFVQLIEKRQGLKIACIEEVALIRGFIDETQFAKLTDSYKDGSDYKNYLTKIKNEKAKNRGEKCQNMC
jgi:glucose-1-phosphate thymidylyltransferase